MGCEWNVGGTVGGSTCDKDKEILSLDENVMQLNKATVCLASISLRQKTLTWRTCSIWI